MISVYQQQFYTVYHHEIWCINNAQLFRNCEKRWSPFDFFFRKEPFPRFCGRYGFLEGSKSLYISVRMTCPLFSKMGATKSGEHTCLADLTCWVFFFCRVKFFFLKRWQYAQTIRRIILQSWVGGFIGFSFWSKRTWERQGQTIYFIQGVIELPIFWGDETMQIYVPGSKLPLFPYNREWETQLINPTVGVYRAPLRWNH